MRGISAGGTGLCDFGAEVFQNPEVDASIDQCVTAGSPVGNADKFIRDGDQAKMKQTIVCC